MRERWLTGRALLFHVLVVSFVTLCVVAGWWQLHQALRGNTLSWAYTVEWPIFAIIAVVAWWHLIHEDPAARDERAELAARTELAAGDASAGDPSAGDEPVGAAPVGAALRAEDEPETAGAYASRVAAAAHDEYRAHLALLAEREAASPWRHLRPPDDRGAADLRGPDDPRRPDDRRLGKGRQRKVMS